MLRNNLLILFCLCSMSFFGQEPYDFFTEEATIRNRNHFEFGIGTSNFLGDLGGKDSIGTNDLQDLELTQFNMAAFMGLRHSFTKNFYGRFNMTYGKVSGDDKLTNEPFRRNRNLNFKSNIFEFDLMGEVWFNFGSRKGHQHQLKRVNSQKGPWHVRGLSIGLFGGVGVFHFNPQAQIQGQWVYLAPLRTEGQGLPGGPDEYKLWQINFPVGINGMVRLHRKWSFGIEATYRFTKTDYIDDVSSTYYDANDLMLYQGEQRGEVAAYLSNPSLGMINEGKPDYVTTQGQQRGDSSDNDGYFYALIKVDYLIIKDSGFHKRKTHKATGNTRSKHKKTRMRF